MKLTLVRLSTLVFGAILGGDVCIGVTAKQQLITKRMANTKVLYTFMAAPIDRCIVFFVQCNKSGTI